MKYPSEEIWMNSNDYITYVAHILTRKKIKPRRYQWDQSKFILTNHSTTTIQTPTSFTCYGHVHLRVRNQERSVVHTIADITIKDMISLMRHTSAPSNKQAHAYFGLSKQSIAMYTYTHTQFQFIYRIHPNPQSPHFTDNNKNSVNGRNIQEVLRLHQINQVYA